MCGEGRGQAHDFDPKEWNPVFLEIRNFKGDEECEEVDEGEEIEEGEDGDDCDGMLELRYTEDTVSAATKEIEKFCGNVQLGDLEDRAHTAGNKFAAWVDDRTRSGEAREYSNSNRLAAIDLYRLLKDRRFDHLDKPDADRRLIYIADLDAFYISALANTAFTHEVEPLVQGFWKYLARRTSITAEIQLGFPIFQLEFHLPYYALRESLPRDDCRQYGVSGEPLRKRIDLSFLQIPTGDSLGQSKHWMYEAQISFLLVGSDDLRWVGYAFDDTYFNDDKTNSVHKDEDPIASDAKPNAHLPIMNARVYFLKILNIRSAKVLREWESLVWTVKREIDTHRTEYSSTLSQDTRKRGKRAQNSKLTFDWTKKAIELLSLLVNSLSGTIKAWDTFNAVNGDILYFSDLYNDPQKPNRTRLLLRDMSRTFKKLENLQQDLTLLKESCESSAQNLHLRVLIEVSEAARKSGLATWFTLMIISPFALATAYFAMPAAVIPFNLNHRAFVIFTFVMTVVVALLFVITETVQNWNGWKKFAGYTKSMWPENLERVSWTSGNGNQPIPKRSHSWSSDSTV